MVFFKRLKKNIAVTLLVGFSNSIVANHPTQELGWVNDLALPTLCQGYYSEPLLNAKQKTGWSIKAHRAEGDLKGNINLYGQVVLRKDGKLLKAKRGYIFRNPKTRKLEKVHLEGDVEYRQPGQLILGKNAILYLNKNSGRVREASYRFTNGPQLTEVVALQRRWYGANAWGQASLVHQVRDDYYKLYDVSYATCPPDKVIWTLQADRMEIDRKAGIGYGYKTRLKIKDHTVFYWPYLTFPTDRRRKSGFLLPRYGQTHRSGTDIAIPYYFNLAPNYDMTVTPHYLSDRGVLTEGEGRYLGPHSHGDIHVAFINHDSRLGRLKNKLKQAGTPLSTEGSQRLGGQARFDWQFRPNWLFQLNYYNVSDDYFFHDLGSSLLIPTLNHLPQTALWHYESQLDLSKYDETKLNPHRLEWRSSRFDLNFTRYKTLHPVEEVAVGDQYSALPKVQYENQFRLGQFQLDVPTEADYFVWPHRSIVDKVSGQRVSAHPQLSYRWASPEGYVQPSLLVYANYYALRSANKFISPLMQPVDEYRSLSIPYVAIDSALYFDKILTPRYRQTLMPRLYYVNIPHREQSTLPLFDTGLKQFTIDYIFSPNRFAGGDRLGDSHHVSYALSSIWHDKLADRDFLELTLGQSHYFRDRQESFCYGRDCVGDDYLSRHARTSPWVGRFNFAWGPYFSTQADYAWLHTTRYRQLSISYQDLPNKIFSLYYDYARKNLRVNEQGAYTLDSVENFGAAFAWPLTKNWHALGSWGYNLTDDNAHTYFAGLEYEHCCWAMRIVGGRKLLYLDVNRKAVYDDALYIQFLIKGLSAIGSSPRSLITGSLPGYQDKFTDRFKL